MFRFTIRDLLWLTMVVALAVGWWIDQRAKSQRIEELEKAASGHMLVYFSGPEPVLAQCRGAGQEMTQNH